MSIIPEYGIEFVQSIQQFGVNMPTYEYECGSCNHRFDAVQKMMDEPLRICPQCGQSIHRILSGGIGISFQGSGFYVNDSSSHKCGGSCSSCKG